LSRDPHVTTGICQAKSKKHQTKTFSFKRNNGIPVDGNAEKSTRKRLQTTKKDFKNPLGSHQLQFVDSSSILECTFGRPQEAEICSSSRTVNNTSKSTCQQEQQSNSNNVIDE
jgi:hypothetical protein